MLEHVLWAEKLRPTTVEDCILPVALKSIFVGIVKSTVVPNLILSGSSGLGKTSVARAICLELDCDYILLNGSLGAEESGIDAMRNRVRSFASSMSFKDARKVVIIDEADYLNPNSVQPALRGLIEEFAANCSFIFTCNNKERIIPAIQSRCTVIDFKIAESEKMELAKQFVKRLFKFLEVEGVTYPDKKPLVAFVVKHFQEAKPDLRKIVIELQNYVKTYNTIDVGILSRTFGKDLNLDKLYQIMKERNFLELRKWVVESLTEEPGKIYRKIYDSLYTKLKPKSIPLVVVLLADYQYKSNFCADQEPLLLAFLVELMVAEFVEYV